MIVVGFGIEQDAVWKVSTKSTPSNNWITSSFDDSKWDDYTGATSTNKVGTVYARKKISGFNGMAAYELIYQVKCGLIIYVNGKEVRRYNMPS